MQLIDYEAYRSGNGRFTRLGIWRAGGGLGRLHRGMSLSELIDRWQKAQAARTFIDLEEYSELPSEIP